MERTVEKDQLTSFKYSDILRMEPIPHGTGTYGVVYRLFLKTFPNECKHAVKKMDLTQGERFYLEKEMDIKREIEILRFISTKIKKPKSLPQFHGFYVLKDTQMSQISYCLVFDIKHGSLKELIEQHISLNKRFTLDEVFSTMQSLLNTMTFLQLSSVTHRDLKPGNILFSNLAEPNAEIQYKSLTLIDFGGSKKVLDVEKVIDNTCILTKRYCSPELMFFSQIKKKEHAQFNPFKSDAFSFGLIILEIGTLKLPFSEKESLKPNDYFNELDNENKRLTEYLRIYYNDLAKKSPENAKKLNDIVSILKKALETKAEKRPDFVELFCEMYKVEGNDSRDSAFILRKLLEIDKKLSSSDVEEEGQQICFILFLKYFS